MGIYSDTKTAGIWRVECRAGGAWTHHSDHGTYRDAVDQSDMVRGRVLCPTGLPDEEAWEWAVSEESFSGDYSEWQSMDNDERLEYEDGARGIGTV